MLRTTVRLTGLFVLAACSRTPPPSADPAAPTVDASAAAVTVDPNAPPVPAGATGCTVYGGPPCFRFGTPEDAFRYVLGKDPLVLAVGEAHAQKGSEKIASSTKRFSESFLPILAPHATDVVVELWAPDAKCMKEVKQVASAQRPVTEAQAATNQNEYVALGTKAKAAGMTPWLLRPTCDDFAMLSDAGADVVDKSLGLIKRLTQAKITQLLEHNAATPGDGGTRTVVAYGGALHNDLLPPAPTKDYTFGPELDRLTHGRFIELDIIVPEFVKATGTWQKLAWYPSFDSDRKVNRDPDKATLYVLGERSYALLFPMTPGADPHEGH